MPNLLTQQQIRERNQIIVDLLSCANGEEIHLNDIAWFLHLDLERTDRWMQQHGRGLWITGKKQHCWRGIGKQSTRQESG